MSIEFIDVRVELERLLLYRNELLITIGLSAVSYALCIHFIPSVMSVLFSRGIYGIDINKNTMDTVKQFVKWKASGNTVELKKLAVPESLGIVVGGVYLCVVAVALLFHSIGATYFSHSQDVGVSLLKANAAINSIAVMLLLGFVDDVLDVKWRHKLTLSVIGVLPLLLAYDGSVSVTIPAVFQSPFIGSVLTRFYQFMQFTSSANETVSVAQSSVLYLGPVYLVYMALFCVFCTNSINILAGVNGVEVGQSIIIAVASIVHNIIQLRHGGSTAAQHILCLLLLCPFVAVSYALWKFNKYPSRVFVGDSYTYFAGMTLAVAGITGAYTKTLMLFFVPQLINFLLSIPQLLKLVPCPRHRVPTWDPKRNILTNSRNYTILNLFLLIFGDMRENVLTNSILVFQCICCIMGFFVRYYMASLLYDRVE